MRKHLTSRSTKISRLPSFAHTYSHLSYSSSVLVLISWLVSNGYQYSISSEMHLAHPTAPQIFRGLIINNGNGPAKSCDLSSHLMIM